MSGLTVDNPIKLADILKTSYILPGDVLTLLPGTYVGDWVIPVSFSGVAGNPVKLKPHIPGTVVIDGSLTVGADYFEIYDLDFTDSRTNRKLLTPAITINGVGRCIYGCRISDLHSSGINWFGSGVGEVCENILLNNGDRYADDSEHGHGLYTHNDGGGARKIGRNVFFDQFGSYTFQIFSSGSNGLKDYTVEDNILCGDPVHTGGGEGLTDFLYQRNVQYGDYCQQGRYGYSHQNQNGQILNNLFFLLTSYTVNQDCDFPWLNLTESGNLVYGGEPSARAGYTVNPVPATWSKVIPFTKSARWVASVAIYNRDSAPTVSVDFTGTFPNGNYRFRNGQNPAETFAFAYAGGAVNVPTNWTSAQRIGDNLPPSTWPVFGGLVVEKA